MCLIYFKLMNFSNNFPEELRSHITISDVVSKRVALKKKGKDYWGLCPFHNEDSPSFSVNDQKGFYHCFGCGAHGDIIGFVINNERLGFKEAVIKLANDYNIKIPLIADQQEDKEQQSKTQRQFLIIEEACRFFENNLFSRSGSEALGYLQQRGLKIEDIKKFRLGFAIDSFDNLLQFLKSKSFSDSEILSVGLLSKSDNGKLYDKFRKRIIFPISNSQGKIIAFGGRILGEGEPKYLNSPETELFHKGKNLYNFSLAKKAIYDQKFVVVVEGYMDAISLAVRGIENVVAPLGTALTIDQLKILLKVTNDIVICLDGDAAGIKAMRRVIDLILPHINSDYLIRFAILPNGNDPDDFVRLNGKNAMEKFLKDAQNLSQVLFEFEAKDLKIDYEREPHISPEKKAKLQSNLFAKVKLISDSTVQKYFGEYYRNLLFEIGKNKNFLHKNSAQKIVANNNEALDAQDSYSLAIVALIANFSFLKNYQDEFCILKNLDFKNSEISQIKDELINFFDQNSSSNFSQVKEFLEKIVPSKLLKTKIFTSKFSDQNQEIITKKMRLFLLKYFYEETKHQYALILNATHEIETDDKQILQGKKQKELFNYKTDLERKILELESDMI